MSSIMKPVSASERARIFAMPAPFTSSSAPIKGAMLRMFGVPM